MVSVKTEVLLKLLHHKTKKTDVAEHLAVFPYVGLLVNAPPSTAGLLFN